nr:efflux transporter outer membrane subunit [uncultured Zoogloea sp.]
MHHLYTSLALLLAGCALTPPLERPAPPIAAVYADGTDTAGNAADLGWRQMFGDPRLQALIATALDNNRDLRIAVLNMDAVRAQYGIERSALLPQVDANLRSGRERTPANRSTPAIAQGNHTAGVAISAFEIDLFGRVRALSEAALARYLASAEAARSARISLVAAVADAYIEERMAMEQLRLTETTLADWRQSLNLARLLKDAKQNSGLDVAQAEGQVASAEADLEGRRRDLKQARNALTVLLGTAIPGDLPAGMPLEDQPVPTALPPGLPSDLLLRRPDILQAEQNLRAANADIGAARAAFFRASRSPQRWATPARLSAAYSRAASSPGASLHNRVSRCSTTAASRQHWISPRPGAPLRLQNTKNRFRQPFGKSPTASPPRPH